GKPRLSCCGGLFGVRKEAACRQRRRHLFASRNAGGNAAANHRHRRPATPVYFVLSYIVASGKERGTHRRRAQGSGVITHCRRTSTNTRRNFLLLLLPTSSVLASPPLLSSPPAGRRRTHRTESSTPSSHRASFAYVRPSSPRLDVRWFIPPVRRPISRHLTRFAAVVVAVPRRPIDRLNGRWALGNPEIWALCGYLRQLVRGACAPVSGSRPGQSSDRTTLTDEC
ncbi:hypothetical protein GGS23DRAFT_577600, partial [Durotheca rogersii]|uniref:uncharacterized protein n=1 Tax=Durotheca rogersii TaxID=419775 RepID=UPI00221F5E4C